MVFMVPQPHGSVSSSCELVQCVVSRVQAYIPKGEEMDGVHGTKVAFFPCLRLCFYSYQGSYKPCKPLHLL